jgi:hypothetical protein
MKLKTNCGHKTSNAGSKMHGGACEPLWVFDINLLNQTIKNIQKQTKFCTVPTVLAYELIDFN